MSDRLMTYHRLACDWPGCKETAQNDLYDGNATYQASGLTCQKRSVTSSWIRTFCMIPPRDWITVPTIGIGMAAAACPGPGGGHE